MEPEYITAVTAITMTSKENLKVEVVKSNLRNYSLTLEPPGPVLFTPAKEETTVRESFGKRGTHQFRPQFCGRGMRQGHINRNSFNRGGSRSSAGISTPRRSMVCNICMKNGHIWKECNPNSLLRPTKPINVSVQGSKSLLKLPTHLVK